MKNSVALACRISLIVAALLSTVQCLIGCRWEAALLKFISCTFPILLLLSIDLFSKKELGRFLITAIALGIASYLFGVSLVFSGYDLAGAIKSSWHQMVALFTFVLVLNVDSTKSLHNLLAKVSGIKRIF